MSQVRIFLFFIGILTSLSIQAREMIFNDIRKNKSLFHLLILNAMDVKELIRCQQYCILHDRCQSVNFNEKKKKCRLLKDSMFYCLPDMVIQDEKGWDYYGQREMGEKSGMVTSKLYCYPKEHMVVTENVLTTLPFLYKTFIFSVSIKPARTAIAHTTANVIHATQGGNGGYGNRVPGIWFYRETTNKLLIYIPLNGVNKVVSPAKLISENSYTPIIFSQLKNHTDNQYYYQIMLDSEVIFYKRNTKPDIFKDVKLYASGMWHSASNAYIKDLKYYTIEE